MNIRAESTSVPLAGRVNSIDFFRGLTMFLLAGESTGLFSHLLIVDNPFVRGIAQQLHHHDWHGLHFWDLIQPFFMFIVGVAIPFAVANRLKKGDSERRITLHAWKRSLLLLFFGWAVYCIGPGKIVWQFQNVLAQLSVTYLIAFLIRDKSFTFQLLLTFILLLLMDLAYRYFPVEGFNHPWVNFENLGNWVNNNIEGVDRASEWATLNVITTASHTVWGVLCGKLLMSKRSGKEKTNTLLIAGITALAIGYALDILNITPIIKKIATSSFVFVSGGWAILVLCLFYWLVDVRKSFATGENAFKIIGMNSIFIYLLFEIGGSGFIGRIFIPFTRGLLGWAGELAVNITNSVAVWASLWFICYWLYKNKIFIKI